MEVPAPDDRFAADGRPIRKQLPYIPALRPVVAGAGLGRYWIVPKGRRLAGRGYQERRSWFAGGYKVEDGCCGIWAAIPVEGFVVKILLGTVLQSVLPCWLIFRMLGLLYCFA